MPFSDNERVKILKGTYAGKLGTTRSVNVSVDGVAAVRTYDFDSIEAYAPTPPPPSSPYPDGLIPTTAPIFDGRKATDQFPGNPFPWSSVQQWGATATRVSTGGPFGEPFYRWKVNPGGERAEALTFEDVRPGTTEITADALYIPSSNKALGWEPVEHAIFQFAHPGQEVPHQGLLIAGGWGADNGLYVRTGNGNVKLLGAAEMYDRVIYWASRTVLAQHNGRFEFWLGKTKVVDQPGPTMKESVPSNNKQGLYGRGRGNVVECLGHRRWRI